MIKSMGHSSLLISDYILCKHGCKFTPFQLIKLVYISHGRTLAALDEPLIHDRIEAWRYGPVMPVLYHELKMWRDETVKNLHYCGTKPSDHALLDERLKFFQKVLSKKEMCIIDDVVKDYGDMSFDKLQFICHVKDSPWDQRYDGELYTEIPDSIIKEYYKKQIKHV